MVAVPVATLRTWEDRYQLVVPERNASGRRLYSRDQVEQLKFVKSRIAGGISAADAHRLLAERGEELAPSPSTQRASARLLILLAERDKYSADFEEYFLRTEGFMVEVALSAAAARQSLREKAPSVAVVDLLISGGTGLDLCRFFKETSEAAVIAVSVLESRDQAIEAGADAFLPKPIDHLQLVSTVRDLLGSSAFLAGQ